MSALRAAAQLLRMPVSAWIFVPPATTRAETAQRAIPPIELNTYRLESLPYFAVHGMPHVFDAVHWDHEPTPDPSREGNSTGADDRLFPPGRGGGGSVDGKRRSSCAL